jgi:hypothetical protein
MIPFCARGFGGELIVVKLFYSSLSSTFSVLYAFLRLDVLERISILSCSCSERRVKAPRVRLRLKDQERGNYGTSIDDLRSD